ncbi:hypothetical protein LCGC14_0510230 [marine sediment metagenome]|uniref:Uncharacterized protein n=1 Tax=marine sediment metagenome TaxID=412755 RepID=A0A0F9SJV6_9ZZZZ
MTDLEYELNEAEKKAWKSLARYKFQMFGYWAAIWVHLNRIGHFKRPNPFRNLVILASDHRKSGGDNVQTSMG